MIIGLIRGLASIVAAMILSIVGVIGVELMSSILHPLPADADPHNMEVMCEHVARYPTGVLLLCAIGWWLTVLASCWLATRLGANRHPIHGAVVGLVLFSLAILNVSMLPYPTWFWINAIAIPASGLVGTWLGGRGYRPACSLSSPE